MRSTPRQYRKIASEISCLAARASGSPMDTTVDGQLWAMKVGVSIGDLTADVAARVTEEADRLGFDSVWLPEHLVMPVEVGATPFAAHAHPTVPSDTPFPEPFTFLAFLAARTSRIGLATHVYNIGLRHPFTAARAVTTL